MSQTTTDKPPGLFSSKPTALLAALAVGSGAIALGSLGAELLTGRSLARVLPIGVEFISAPLGVATIVLAVLTARTKPSWALPAFALGAAYWIVFAMMWGMI